MEKPSFLKELEQAPQLPLEHRWGAGTGLAGQRGGTWCFTTARGREPGNVLHIPALPRLHQPSAAVLNC